MLLEGAKHATQSAGLEPRLAGDHPDFASKAPGAAIPFAKVICPLLIVEIGDLSQTPCRHTNVSRFFRNRTPAPPPFSGMNSTPASSSARRMASTVRG